MFGKVKFLQVLVYLKKPPIQKHSKYTLSELKNFNKLNALNNEIPNVRKTRNYFLIFWLK